MTSTTSYYADLDGIGTLLDEDQEMENDSELESIKARVREIEMESSKIKSFQLKSEPTALNRVKQESEGIIPTLDLLEEKVEADGRSVYVGNVDYGSTAEELEHHFSGCGQVNRVTILCNKFDGSPKGFAYIEFLEKRAIFEAMMMDQTLFRGRTLKVMPKRTNQPGISTTNRPPRGRGGRGPSFYRGQQSRPGFAAAGQTRFFGPTSQHTFY